MKNILWLVSWYPNHYDSTNGDFIQRHAQALALFANVHVLFVTPVNEPDADYLEEGIKTNGNLTEQVIYYKANESSIVGKIQSRLRYLKLSKYFIKQYIQEHGMPAYVHVHVPIRAGLVGLWMKRKYNLNYALTEHYGIYNNEVADSFNNRNVFYRNSVKKIIKNAVPFLPVSKNIAEDINRVAIKKDYTVVPNVVNTDYFNYKEKVAGGRFKFLHVSNMIPLKNVEKIIDAAALLSKKRNDFELRIAGPCPTNVLDYTTQTGLLDKHIFFTGEIPYQDVANEMQQAGAFILFSQSESASCVMQESLCCGLPVISTPVGIALEAVNEQNGFFVEKNNVQSLFEKMNEMMNNYAKYNRKTISEKYCRLYNYEAIGKSIFESYGLKS